MKTRSANVTRCALALALTIAGASCATLTGAPPKGSEDAPSEEVVGDPRQGSPDVERREERDLVEVFDDDVVIDPAETEEVCEGKNEVEDLAASRTAYVDAVDRLPRHGPAV